MQKILGLTNTQFRQIMDKKLNLKSLKLLEKLALEEIINKTKWLIEENLELELVDFYLVILPAIIFITMTFTAA